MITKQSIGAQVADEIRSRILQGHYKAGVQLRQEHIAAELGVSRIPVREALHQLKAEGFVTHESHKGSVVAEISSEEFVEFYELRARIEPWLLELAIPRMTATDFVKIRAAAEQFVHTAQTSERVHEANWAFHRVLYEPAGRPATLEILDRVNKQIERYTRMIMSVTGIDRKSHKEHLALIELCERGDVGKAVKMLTAHITEGTSILAERLKLKTRGAGNGSAKVVQPVAAALRRRKASAV